METQAIKERFLNKQVKVFTRTDGFCYKGTLTAFEDSYVVVFDQKLGETILFFSDIKNIHLNNGEQ